MNKNKSALPIPSSNALAISTALLKRIQAEIRDRGGWISFARYMELVLYEPGLGYYSGGSTKLGQGFKDDSDFSTAPEMTPLFGRALARQVGQILELSSPQILEFGAGSGRLALDILLELERLDALPEHYAILDLSADLRERQKQTIAAHAPHLLERVMWLDRLPDVIEGAVIGNEVLDAMPVHLAVKSADGWQERGVAVDGQSGLIYLDHMLDHKTDAELLTAIQTAIPDSDNFPAGYVTEINPAATAFIATITRQLRQGALLLIDYGFPGHEYYHPQRAAGTLMMHYRHQAHADPFLWPGLQDITAHVDFSAVQTAALTSGADLLGYTSQARFLINCGITHLIEGLPGEDSVAWLRQTNALQKLISEAEMGELFKVIALGKGIEEELVGFIRGDRSHVL